MSPFSRGTPDFRISDADRERAATRLRTAHAEGRLSLAELEERTAAVYPAVLSSDLRPIFADIPGDEVVVAPLSVPASKGGVVELRAGGSGLKRDGDWTVPQRLVVKGALGSVVLDLSRARIEHPVVAIELALGTGSAKILLPAGATANVDAVATTVGSVTSKVPADRTEDALHVVLTGRTHLGSVVVRYPRGIGRLKF